MSFFGFSRQPDINQGVIQYQNTPGAILLDVRTASSLRLPGFMPPRSIPYAVIVSADGTVLQKGHGGIVLNWREITKKGN